MRNIFIVVSVFLAVAGTGIVIYLYCTNNASVDLAGGITVILTAIGTIGAIVSKPKGKPAKNILVNQNGNNPISIVGDVTGGQIGNTTNIHNHDTKK